MIKYFLFIVITLMLWHMSLSTHECTRTISDSEITFSCPANVSNQELRLYDLNTTILDSITSIVATLRDASVSRGPFTSIPPNICLLRNLRKVDFSSNQISIVDPANALPKCFTNVITLRLPSNIISEFPSFLIYNMPNLKTLDFSTNQLTDIPANAFLNISLIETIDFSFNQLTTFELWALEVTSTANFRNNQISRIANTYFFDKFLNTSNTPTIYLSDNSATIDFSDTVYEMYNQCSEVRNWYFFDIEPLDPPLFTRKLAQIDFGTTQINCSCAQIYFLTILKNGYGDIEGLPINTPIRTATCASNSETPSSTGPFFNYTCISTDTNSTADFSQVYPKLCKISLDEEGDITPIVNMTAPSSNVSTYPHYETAFLTPGACFFTFITATSMSIHCTDDTSNSLSQIPTDLLSNTYMSTITHVTFPSTISSLPSYLCSLPSREIDLSYQAFTTLTDATFPCLDSFTKVTLSFNQLTSVNMTNGDFKNLTYLDLSSNYLTSLPYTILRPTPSSLNYLDLRNNSIRSIDLFLYTLKNITVNLDNNLINSSNIINPQNVTLDNSTSTVIITYPTNVTANPIIIQDSTVASLVACASFSSIQSFLLNFRSASSNMFLLCTCASFRLKELYRTNNLTITNDFNCSATSQAAIFLTLTSTNCANSTQFPTESCAGTTQITSTSFTIIMTNLSNETQNIYSTEINPTITIENSESSTTTSSSVQSSNAESSSNRTGLIVGLVVGIVGFFLLLGAIIVVILCLKSKSASASGKKHISRAKVVGQTDRDTLQSRVQSRNLRTVKLAPLAAPTSELPKVPVSTFAPTTKTTNPSLLSYPNSTLGTPAKGIPIRLDSIKSPSDINPQYPPNSNALNNSSSFRPINNRSTYQIPIPQQQEYQAPKPQKPRGNLLNAGGDTRY